MSEKHNIIPVWFFVGALLLVYGIIITISGVVEWSAPAEGVVLANLHAPVWWGIVLTVLGAIYCALFKPSKNN